MEKTYVKILQIGMTKNWGGLETYLLQQFEKLKIAQLWLTINIIIYIVYHL